MTLSAWVHAMAIDVLSTLSRAMTISLSFAMNIAVRNAVLTPLYNAVLIALNFSMLYAMFHAMFHAESVQVSARCYERSLFFFLYFLSGATARPKILGGMLLDSSA